jgi:flagellin-specific chaperone FliS
LSRRYFIFFDTLYQAGRHNKQLWKVITELNNGENEVPYGSCIFEAHVVTTVQENYYKWLFLLLSDIDEVRDEHFRDQFKMEYECIDEETGELPEQLIDYQHTNCRLGKSIEIYFDENESDRRKLLKVKTDPEGIEEIKRKEREELEALVHSVRKQHQKRVQQLREKVRYIRDIRKGSRTNSTLSDEDIKKLVSVEKRRLIEFRSEEKSGGVGRNQPEAKKRKVNDHKSRCTDMKIQFFQKTKERLDLEECEGLIESWGRVYKYIMNKLMKTSTKDQEPVMKEPSKMLNELGKAVDLDEIMNEGNNSQNEWATV